MHAQRTSDARGGASQRLPLALVRSARAKAPRSRPSALSPPPPSLVERDSPSDAVFARLVRGTKSRLEAFGLGPGAMAPGRSSAAFPGVGTDGPAVPAFAAVPSSRRCGCAAAPSVAARAAPLSGCRPPAVFPPRWGDAFACPLCVRSQKSATRLSRRSFMGSGNVGGVSAGRVRGARAVSVRGSRSRTGLGAGVASPLGSGSLGADAAAAGGGVWRKGRGGVVSCGLGAGEVLGSSLFSRKPGRSRSVRCRALPCRRARAFSSLSSPLFPAHPPRPVVMGLLACGLLLSPPATPPVRARPRGPRAAVSPSAGVEAATAAAAAAAASAISSSSPHLEAALRALVASARASGAAAGNAAGAGALDAESLRALLALASRGASSLSASSSSSAAAAAVAAAGSSSPLLPLSLASPASSCGFPLPIPPRPPGYLFPCLVLVALSSALCAAALIWAAVASVPLIRDMRRAAQEASRASIEPLERLPRTLQAIEACSQELSSASRACTSAAAGVARYAGAFGASPQSAVLGGVVSGLGAVRNAFAASSQRAGGEPVAGGAPGTAYRQAAQAPGAGGAAQRGGVGRSRPGAASAGTPVRRRTPTGSPDERSDTRGDCVGVGVGDGGTVPRAQGGSRAPAAAAAAAAAATSSPPPSAESDGSPPPPTSAVAARRARAASLASSSSRSRSSSPDGATEAASPWPFGPSPFRPPATRPPSPGEGSTVLASSAFQRLPFPKQRGRRTMSLRELWDKLTGLPSEHAASVAPDATSSARPPAHGRPPSEEARVDGSGARPDHPAAPARTAADAAAPNPSAPSSPAHSSSPSSSSSSSSETEDPSSSSSPSSSSPSPTAPRASPPPPRSSTASSLQPAPLRPPTVPWARPQPRVRLWRGTAWAESRGDESRTLR